MPITPADPYPKSRGETVRAADWNQAVDEVIRLDGDKVNRAGDTITGPLTVAGALALNGPGQRRLQVGGTVAGLGVDGSDASPNAAYLRFGDGSGWRLHIGRHTDSIGGPPNAGTNGVLATFTDSGHVGIGTPDPQATLQVGSETVLHEDTSGQITSVGHNGFFGGYFGQGLRKVHDQNASAYMTFSTAISPYVAVNYQAVGETDVAHTLASFAPNGSFISGDLTVVGALSKGSGSFVMDHPLDPDGKTLRHNLVESPEHLCAYRGRVTLDGDGQAAVDLPGYFAALTDEQNATVHLTCAGDPSPAGYRWNDTHTAVAVLGTPGTEVAYLVLAARDDPVVRQLGRPVEEEKGDGNFEKGQLLYPEAFGRPAEKGLTMLRAVSTAALQED